MRLSVDINSPDFHRDAYRYDVYLNGERQERCIAADDGEGWVEIVSPWPPVDTPGIIQWGWPRVRLYGQVTFVRVG